jgi:hypothetical protein
LQGTDALEGIGPNGLFRALHQELAEILEPEVAADQ